MSLIYYGCLTILLLGTEVLYLVLARHFRLFDVPNQRSLHQTATTVRGGGLIIYLAVLVPVLTGSFDQPYFFWGLTLVVVISFLDDLYTTHSLWRLVIQFIAVGLLLGQTCLYPDGWWLFLGMLVLGVGILNSCNFMDGINGMTAFYGLVSIGTLWCMQDTEATAGSAILNPSVFVALLVFSFFNARPKALCFAGDVGSIGLGFILLYGLLILIRRHHTYLPLLLLAVYGTDSLLTIMHRLYHRQNIFRAHRQHLFQLLVSERGWSHRKTALLYALTQAVINGLVVLSLDWTAVSQILLAGSVTAFLSLLHLITRKNLAVRHKKWLTLQEVSHFQGNR